MLTFFSGIIIGTVMGLTGSGGALVAIPLFMHWLQMSLKEASILSLIAVVTSSFFGFLSQRKNADLRSSFLILIFSAFGSYLSIPFKTMLSDQLISWLIILIAIYALYAIWFFQSKESPKDFTNLRGLKLALPTGAVLGVLTTLTGLGGGVLMMPIFLTVYHFSYPKALASSLLTVGLSSFFSLILQVFSSKRFELSNQIYILLFGILLSVLLLKGFIKFLPIKVLDKVRKVVFTLVVVFVMVKLF